MHSVTFKTFKTNNLRQRLRVWDFRDQSWQFHWFTTLPLLNQCTECSTVTIYILCHRCHHRTGYFNYSMSIPIPHRGQPPCRGGGALHRWPERFLKSGGEDLTKSWPNLWEQIRYTLPVLLCWFRLHSRLQLYSRLFTALQLSIYGFTAVYDFIAVTCNLVVTFGDVHWAELIRPQRWADVRACPPRR